MFSPGQGKRALKSKLPYDGDSEQELLDYSIRAIHIQLPALSTVTR